MPGPGKTGEANQQVSGEEWSSPSPRSPLVRPCCTSSPSLVGRPMSEGQSTSHCMAVGNRVEGPVAEPPEGASVQDITSAASDRPALSDSQSYVCHSAPAASTQLWEPLGDHPSSPIRDFKCSLDFEGSPFSGKTQLPPDCDSGPFLPLLLPSYPHPSFPSGPCF